MFEYLRELKTKVSQKNFKLILDMATEDIKFNNVRFGKITSQSEFVGIVERCYVASSKCEMA